MPAWTTKRATATSATSVTAATAAAIDPVGDN